MGNEAAREAWLERTLRQLRPNSRILDAGAGTQRYRRFCSHLRYVSQDFAAYDGRGDNSGLQTDVSDYGKLDIISDITAIPEANASFDAIMCTEVFEHVPDPLLVLSEFRRLLKPEGHLILTAPFCSLTHMAPYHFCTGFSRYWHITHLPKHGFETVEITPNGNYFEYLAQEVYRVPYVASRYADASPHIWEWAAMYVMQRMLLRFSRRDKNSQELLCYGYNVLAKRGRD